MKKKKITMITTKKKMMRRNKDKNMTINMMKDSLNIIKTLEAAIISQEDKVVIDIFTVMYAHPMQNHSPWSHIFFFP